METKKNSRASLENKRTMFFEIGLIAALAVVLTSFEWNTATKEVGSISAGRISLVDDETVPITQQETPPPPENIKEPVISEELQIVENDVKVNTDFTSFDDNTEPIKIVPYIEQSNKTEEEEVEEYIPFANLPGRRRKHLHQVGLRQYRISGTGHRKRNTGKGYRPVHHRQGWQRKGCSGIERSRLHSRQGSRKSYFQISKMESGKAEGQGGEGKVHLPYHLPDEVNLKWYCLSPATDIAENQLIAQSP